MHMLKKDWNDHFRYLSYSGIHGNAPVMGMDGVVVWEAGNPNANAMIDRLNAGRGWRATFSMDVYADDESCTPRIRARVVDGAELQLTGTVNQERYSQHGSWQRLTCSVVSNHPRAEYFSFLIDAPSQSGGAFKMRNAAIRLDPVDELYARGLAGWHVGDENEGCVMYPDGRVKYWKNISHSLVGSFEDYQVPVTMVRFKGDFVSGRVSVRDTGGVSAIATAIAGIVVRCRPTGLVTLTNTVAESATVPLRLVVEGYATRVGY